MISRNAVLGGAVALACAFTFASAPAHSFTVASPKANSDIVLIKKDGGHRGGNKNWNKHGGNKNWSNKGGHNKWSSKGRGGKKWSKHGNKWYAGQHYRGGYWRNGIFVSLPFVVGSQCYDYLDWRDGAPRPGWYWVC